jgi:hypothetical protein
MKKPYLINCASRTIDNTCYEKSVPKLENSAELISIWFDKYPGHLYRWDCLLDMKLDPNRWWIFTDYGDVIFQTPIPDLDVTKHDIIVTDEHYIHGSDYWQPFILPNPIFKPLLSCTVYNVGTFAMKGFYVIEFIKYLQEFRKKIEDRTTQVYEQLIYNMWIQEHKYDFTTHPTLMITLANNIKERRVEFKNGQFVNLNGKPYTFVHACGDTKAWLRLLD